MNSRHRLVIICISLFIVSCESRIDHLEQYHLAYSKWSDVKITSYSMSYTKYCFCPESGLNINLLVENNKIVSVNNPTGSNVDVVKVFSVEKLYMLIDQALKDKNYKIVNIVYDEKYGFPSTIEINNPSKTDAGIKVLVTDFKPAQVGLNEGDGVMPYI